MGPERGRLTSPLDPFFASAGCGTQDRHFMKHFGMTRVLDPASSFSPKRASSDPYAVKATTKKLPENTVRGCRDRAEQDLVASVTSPNANQRVRLEHSAQSWTIRADMLDRLNKSFDKRAALDLASRVYEANLGGSSGNLGLSNPEAPCGLGEVDVAKGQRRSNKEVRKPKANQPKKASVSAPSLKASGGLGPRE